MSSFWMAACGSGEKAGLYRGEFVDGRYVQRYFLRQQDMSYLTWSPDHRFLYAAIETKPVGGVASFRVNGDGSLTPWDKWLADGQCTCHVAVSPDGRFLFAANYKNGRLLQFPLEGGCFTREPMVVQHTGHGVNPERQEAPHVHYVILSPDNRYVCTVDLGLDCIDAYPLSEGGICPSAVRRTLVTPAGSGPRHFVFGQDGKTAYLVNELGNTVMSLAYEDGRFTVIQRVPMVPSALNVFSKASAIRLSADGRYLLASNRGYDTIVTWQIQKDGGLKEVASSFVGAQGPRDFNFLPGGKKVAVGGEYSNNVFFFDFDGETGRLIPDGNVIPELPRPICFLG